MKVWSETLLVVSLGLAFGFVANALSPRGLSLRQNYFPTAAPISPPTPLPTAPAHSTAGDTNVAPTAAAESPVVARLRSRGLTPATLAEIKALHADPRFALGQYVFLDDRDHDYAEGHVPGAHQFFHYRATDYLPTLLPVLMAAEKIVVYCTGGTCEDSEFAAVMLAEMGIPREKLLVFVGGIKEWKAAGLPVETGARNSGQLMIPPK
jgi:rhodanese-related sulfurtransferase